MVEEQSNAQVLISLSVSASQAGLVPGQSLRDARSICPRLITHQAVPQQDSAFLKALARWAGKFSPWVTRDARDALMLDITGCSHLFGGEAGILSHIDTDCARFGLTVQTGIADTVGAAWALARYAGQPIAHARSGDAIDQEARATRSRAAKKRHWEKGGTYVQVSSGKPHKQTRIIPPDRTRFALMPFPVEALRLSDEDVTTLHRLGLRQIKDIIDQPRAPLTRRFGPGLIRRLDQALGHLREPISPGKTPPHFAVRMTFPDPIGLEEDILLALGKILPRLETKLTAEGHGARMIRLEAHRTDQDMQWVEVGLARPITAPDRILPLLKLKLSDIDAGYGIDMLRIEATRTEPLKKQQQRAAMGGHHRGTTPIDDTPEMADLIGKIGARIGLEAITRRHPGDSHLPEKAAQTFAAAWSKPVFDWPRRTAPRPLLFWRPEVVIAPEHPIPPESFRWRGRTYVTIAQEGPERIGPEWWLDDPDWRTGLRDYWRITTKSGERLWLYFAHGATLSPGWFCQGSFA